MTAIEKRKTLILHFVSVSLCAGHQALSGGFGSRRIARFRRHRPEPILRASQTCVRAPAAQTQGVCGDDEGT